MQADGFITAHVFEVFGIAMLVGVALLSAALYAKDKLKRGS
jgi:hypothetical protein